MFSLMFVLLVASTLTACEASFEDLRDNPQVRPGNIDPFVDPLANNDARDMGIDDFDIDGTDGDAGPGDLEMSTDTIDAESSGMGEETVIAMGEIQAGPDYGGEGTVSLVQLAEGSYELRFEDDFRVDRVPGPVVVLSLEPTLGSDLDSQRGDVELGVLESNSGASSYSLPFAPGQRRYSWIYCKPFGLEVVRAELMELN